MEQVKANKSVDFLIPPPCQVIAMAIDGSKKNMSVAKWALDNFSSELNTKFKLLHVRPRTTHVLTPVGRYIPISQALDDVAAAFINKVDQKTKEMLRPYKKYFSQKKVEVDIVVIESDDVSSALVNKVAKDTITKLVIGASSTSMFTRREKYLSAKIAKRIPKFCTVCVISRGNLISMRSSDSETNGSIRGDDFSGTISTNGSLSHSSSFQTDPGSAISYSHLSFPSFRAFSTITSDDGSTISQDSDEASFSPKCHIDSSDEYEILGSSRFELFELDKIIVELRQIRGMYAVTQSERIDASQKVNDIMIQPSAAY